MLSEVGKLNRIRLELDLTFEEMAAAIGVTRQTLYRVLTVPDVRVHDRTLFRIQRFLEKRAKGAA